MDKLKKHLKNNLAIYMVIIACAVVLGITLFMTREEEVPRVDTSMFVVLDINQALDLFKRDETVLLVISTSDCAATIKYVDYLKISQALNKYNTHYLELDNLDPESKEVKELISKLDIDYNLKGKVAKFGEFLGTTPMTVIIKNGRMVHGYIGSMDTDTLTTFTSLYGVSKNEKN